MGTVQQIFGATSKSVLNKPYLKVEEREIYWQNGPALSSGNNIRDLNYVVINEITSASLQGSLLTLPAGRYYMKGYVGNIVHTTGSKHRVSIMEESSSYDCLVQGSSASIGGTYAASMPQCEGVVELFETTTIKLNHYSSVTTTASGGGVALDDWLDNIYASLEVWKLDANYETPVVSDPTMTLKRPFLQVQDQKPSGTHGGDAVIGANRRDLNTVVTNEIAGASLSANEITLPAGTYYAEGVCCYYAGSSSANRQDTKAFIRKSDGTTLLSGLNKALGLYDAVNEVSGEFTLTETTSIKFDQEWAIATVRGFGQSGSYGDYEMYSDLKIWQQDALRSIEAITDPLMTLKRPMFHAQDHKATNTGGGTPVAASYNERDLNTVVSNDIPGAVLGSNEISLPAGKYYIDATAPTFRSLGNRVDLRDTSDNVILYGETAYNYTSDTVGLNAHVRGEFTLATSTVVKLSHYITSSFVDNGLGAPSNISPNESFTDVRIWQLDAVSTTPVLVNDKLYPLPGNTLVTGNMHGLGYSPTPAANSVTVQAGICMDSTNSVLLQAASQQSVTIPSTINTVHSLFLCDDGMVRTDTDVNGANLSAYSIRWIGFVLINSSGVLAPMIVHGDWIFCDDLYPDWLLANPPGGNVWVQFDASVFMPLERVESINYSISTNASSLVYMSSDGSTNSYRYDNTDPNLIGMQAATSGVPPEVNWIKHTASSIGLQVAQIKIKR